MDAMRLRFFKKTDLRRTSFECVDFESESFSTMRLSLFTYVCLLIRWTSMFDIALSLCPMRSLASSRWRAKSSVWWSCAVLARLAEIPSGTNQLGHILLWSFARLCLLRSTVDAWVMRFDECSLRFFWKTDLRQTRFECEDFESEAFSTMRLSLYTYLCLLFRWTLMCEIALYLCPMSVLAFFRWLARKSV